MLRSVVNAQTKNAYKLPQTALPVSDLGQGHQGTCPQAIHLGHGYAGLLLRSAEHMAVGK